MFAPSRLGTALTATIGIAIAATVGYVLHKVAKEHSERRAVVTIVGDTTAQLRDGLKRPTPGVLEKIEGNLKKVKRWNNAEIADATEIYLIGAREIMRRRAEADRLSEKAAASRAALDAHMDRASRRDTAWIYTAMQLKKQVDRDHFDLDVQLKALTDLIESLPQAHRTLAPHVSPALFLDDNARKQVLRQVKDEARRASAEREKVRHLN